MNKVVTIISVALTSAGLVLAGCTPGNNVPGSTAAGAVAGGLAGGLLFKGSPAGIVGGALLGGIVGNAVGNQMNAADEARFREAALYAPVDETVVWTNEDTGVVYRVRPTRVYVYEGRSCRDYTTRVYMNGRWRTTYGRVCEYPSGWRYVGY